MSSKTPKIAITSITILLTVVAAHYRHTLNCGEQPVSTWIVGCLVMLSVGCLLANTNEMISAYPKLSYAALLFLLPVAVVSVIIWSVLGSVWIMQNMLFGNKCLPTVLSVAILWGMLVTHIAVIISLCTAVILGAKVLTKRNKESCIKKVLISIYNNKRKCSVDQIDELMEERKELLDSLPLFQEEQAIIERDFSQTVTNFDEERECAICLCEFVTNEKKTTFGCKHEYHLNCISDWLAVKPNCPCCRSEFRPAVLMKYRKDIINCC